MDDKKLNKEQRAAIRHGDGPLLIIAGAGTGKTTVVTERIKHIIAKGLAKSSEILALTFTEKAAREMEERVDVALPLGYTQMWISTFHAFCDRILRRETLHIGLDPRYKLMTQTETIQFVRKNLFEFELEYFRPLGNPNKFIEGMLAHFSRLADEDISPMDYIQWVQKSKIQNLKSQNRVEEAREGEESEIAKWNELANAYQTYRELKVKNGVMDFSDLIGETNTLFRKRRNVLEEYRKQFKYVLVDEFQDTNVAQYELIKLLTPSENKPNLTLVGDDSQSIYKFRGAAISNILKFTSDYKNAKTFLLTKNYRSGQNILDVSYKLIQFNNPDTLEVRLGINKKLESVRSKQSGIKGEKDEEVLFIHEKRVENEADRVALEIKNLISDSRNNLNYGDFAILVRANNHAEPFMRSLERHGLPYQFLGPGKLFRQPEIIFLISYLKVLYDLDDSQAFLKLLSSDYMSIVPRDLVRLSNSAKKQNCSLFEVIEKAEDLVLTPETHKKLETLITVIKTQIEKIHKASAGQLLYNFLETTELLPVILHPDTPEAEKRAKNITKFFDKLKTYEVEHDDASVFAVVDYIDLASELGESPLASDMDWTEVNAINILSIHSSKGLEFPIVFLVNLVSQRFPTMERREQIPIPTDLIKEVLPEGDYHLQEERRLAYVGMTRAKDRLYLTAADYYGDGKREKKLSPFIFEALGEEVVSGQKSVVSKQLSILDYKLHTSDSLHITHNSQSKTKVNFLSYSQIQTFEICPLHYKLHYIYKLPTPATSAQSFGNSFHLTIKAFYEAVINGKKPTESLMTELLTGNWINEGYISRSHETKSFEKAKSFLHRYLGENFDPHILPIAMEAPFTVSIDSLKIGGKIDRIDKIGDTLHIIDYKTGPTALTQKEADKDLQLSLYALAAATIPEPPFNVGPSHIKLSLIYFDSPQTVTTTRTQAQLEEARQKIYTYKEKIETSDFTCSGNILCRKCEYKLFCNPLD